jgi:hypothetical protein
MSSRIILLNSLKKRKYHVFLIEEIERITFIPKFMFERFDLSALEELNEEAIRYFQLIHQFNEDNQRGVYNLLIKDLKPNLKHHSFHCVSFTAAFHTIIGLTLEDFGSLFVALRVDLEELFPRCPEILGENDISLYCSRRMKLFMTLFRCRQGCSFRHMEVCFGWAHNTIGEDFQNIMLRLQVRMKCYHRGFLKYKGRLWQVTEMFSWRHRHRSDIQLFVRKVNHQNNYSSRHHTPEMIPKDALTEMMCGGSIGAFDCTYSVKSSVSQTTLQETLHTSRDPMYTSHKKVTAWKLGILISHGFDDHNKKYIMYMNYGKATASDTGMYDAAASDLFEVFEPNALVEGDHAFHGCWRMMCPYTQLQANVEGRKDCEHFNHTLSQDRIVSEHGVRFAKEWGVLRGRTDYSLFLTNEHFELAMEVCWALHNYKCDGCPSELATMT